MNERRSMHVQRLHVDIRDEMSAEYALIVIDD
jgi:hypothetical protein